MSQSISRRSFLKCAGSGAVSLAAALLTGVPAAAQQPRLAGEPALLDGKAAVELLGYAPAQEMGNVLVYLSVENLSAAALPVGASYLQSREVRTLSDLYSMGTGVTAVCDGKPVRCGSFAAPLYGENAADASVFTLNLTAGRGALLHCFCAAPSCSCVFPKTSGSVNRSGFGVHVSNTRATRSASSSAQSASSGCAACSSI